MTKSTAIELKSLHEARILIVDDQPSTRASLERVLHSEGATVYTVSSVAEAKELLPHTVLDAAVVDYWLPDEIGVEAMQFLRARPVLCASVMITGTQDPSLVQECLADGAFDVLLKPFELDDFIAAVRSAVARTRIWRATVAATPSAHARDRRFRMHPAPLVPQLVTDERSDRQRELERATRSLAREKQLSKKEVSIFLGVVRGMRNQEIGDAEGIAERTVKFHVANIMKKLGVRSRFDLILLVIFHET
ncbi:MAG: response regulator transcription factor [Deltaproteobacteria bacterium]|jgi:DNA-binding NarL/FixJ family response regulator